MTIPALPPGFVLEDKAAPPLPPGFVPVGSQPLTAPKPSLFRADSDFREKSGAGVTDMLWAAAKDMFGSRESAGRYLAEQTGGSLIDTPEGPAVKLKDGQVYRLNDPGIDNADAANLAGNVAAFSPAAKVASLAVSLPARMGLGGLAAAGTDAALQTGFSDEYDASRTAAASVGGASGELLAPIAGKVIAALRGTTAKGNARAAQILTRDLGVEAPTNAQVKAFSSALDEIDAGADPASILGSNEFGFIYTRGQRLPAGAAKNKALTTEEVLRQDQSIAGDVMRGIERRNSDALQTAVGRQLEGVAGKNRPQTPVEAFERIGERAKGMADELQGKVSTAYDNAAQGQRTAVAADAVRAMPERLQQALREFPVGELTPATRATLESIRAKAAGLPGDAKGITLKAIEEQRRIINHSFGATTTNPTDRAALTVLKREYDSWLDDAFEDALVSGDEQALASMKEARGLRAEFGRRFEGGNTDVDRFIQNMIEGERTADELVNVALGASQVSKASASRYIERLKAATADDPEVMGALKAAHLMRLTHGKNGEMLGMQAIRSNILSAEQNTPSVIRSLYAPGEWSQARRLAQAIEPMVPRGDFARSSGTTERLIRFMQTLPFIGRGLQMVNSPVRLVRASRSTGPLSRPAPRAVAASGAAMAVEADR